MANTIQNAAPRSTQADAVRQTISAAGSHIDASVNSAKTMVATILADNRATPSEMAAAKGALAKVRSAASQVSDWAQDILKMGLAAAAAALEAQPATAPSEATMATAHQMLHGDNAATTASATFSVTDLDRHGNVRTEQDPNRPALSQQAIDALMTDRK